MRPFRIPLIGALGLAAVAFFAVSVNAALPPQYDRWNEFAAIAADSSIPQKLGVRDLVERIERVGDGRYRVHATTCHVEVRLARKARTGPKGEPILGSAIISIAEVSAPRCA
jgi:hypothetical protein